MAKRPLHFIWIVDCSGSMGLDGKIQTVNYAIREAIPHMQEAAADNPHADVLVRAIIFSSGARWHISQPTPVNDFKWTDLSTDGVTDLGRALSLVADQLKIPPMESRALPPVLVLLSDGQPTDDYASGLKALLEQPWGQKAVRIAVAIGSDADRELLQKFIAHPELQALDANSPEALVRLIRWASTSVLKAASAPPSEGPNAVHAAGNVPIPAPPLVAPMAAASDVW